ncbi:MAG TPA: ABC transporter permease [Bryobacteraceae bacterium]|nr:ABC transporter permease [Bryobacteraceae bacterium]
MIWLRRLLLWLPGRRRARALELQEELRANLSLAIQDAAESGLSPEEASRQGHRDFGSLTRAEEESRSVWFPGWDTLSQDVRFALRTLAKTPGFTTVAILSLALGTGAATALFSLVDTVVIKPLTYREPGRLVFVREVVPPLAHIYPTLPVNFQHFKFWREQARSFEGLAAIENGSATMDSGGEPEVVGGAYVSSNLFTLLGVEPQIGRTFQPDEDQPASPDVAVITDGLWRRKFGGSRDVAGQTLRLDGKPYVVIGVLPLSFRFPKKEDLGPLAHLSERSEFFLPLKQANSDGWGGDYDYIVFGRLRRDLTAAGGAAELNLIEQRIAAEHHLNRDLHIKMWPLQEVMGSPVRTSLTVLLAAVLLLVLIVCVNLANLLLARSHARAREFSLRIALGASRGRLLLSAMVETLILAVAGGVLGVLAAQAALNAFVHWGPVDLPRLDEVRVDGRVLAFAFVVSMLCGVLFGLLPALRLSRADPQNALRAGTHTISGSRHGLQLREWLVGAEVSLSTLLLVLAGLLLNSLWHVLRVDRGFAAEQALEVRVSLPSRYQSVEQKAEFFDQAAGRLRSIPGVRAAAASSRVPLTGESNVNHVILDGSDDGALDPVTKQLVMVNVRFVGPEYFSALGIPLLRGRAIESADRDRNVVVVSARLTAKLWPGQNPLGKMITCGSGVSRAEVVGVVGDVHSTQLERDPTLMIYAPFWKRAFQVSGLVVRSSAGSGLAADVRRAIQSIDPGIPAPRMRTMGDLVSESVAGRRFQMEVAMAFALSALLLAALGIYGVVAYGITLRRRELGIRMALGARAASVRRMVVRQGLRPVAVGLVVGMLAAVAAGQLIRTLLFGVSATDQWTFAAIASVLGLVAVLACLFPAHAAARIDPAGVLRED